MEMYASLFFKVVTSSLSLKVNLLNHLEKNSLPAPFYDELPYGRVPTIVRLSGLV